MKPASIYACLALLTLLLTACFKSIEIRPLVSTETEADTTLSSRQNDRLVFRFFDEDFISGGYAYWYPDASKVFIPEESGKNGEVALKFQLEANDYSGGSVCLWNLLYDISPYYAGGALQFWIKGKQGGEIAWVALVDEENSDGKKTVVRLPLSDYGGITNKWTSISIPLSDFGARGVYWDPKKKVEIANRFDWEKVTEFRIEIKKADNKSFDVWVDDIFVVRDVYEERRETDEEYWDEREETLPAPPLADKPNVNETHTIFDNRLAAGGFCYVYGGKTAFKLQPTTSPDNPAVLATYLDNANYSGVTISLGAGKTIDLSKERTTHAGIAFWAKGAPNVKKVYLGLLDDDSDGKKVQTKVALGDFGELDTSWRYFMVPLKKFMAQGSYWDETKNAEIGSDVAWNAVNEVRFSINRYENRVDKGDPVELYIDQLAVIDDIPGYVDPDEFWASFSSDAPDIVLHDFESESDRKWEKAQGPKSRVEFAFEQPEDSDTYGANVLAISYKLGDWCDIYYDYPTHEAGQSRRDWSQHWGLRFSFFTTKAYQPVTVQISDAGNEIFVANVGGQRGWSELLVPFKSFNKFPYYQPPDARQNGVFDLDNVRRIDFKPAGEGTNAAYKIDNIALTNTRQIERSKAPEQVAVTIAADTDQVITPRINDGIFGINAALWDGDLLKPKTADYVKDVNHGVLRYPGGLRADEDHWQEVLARKDWMVDTDEFIEFCRTTGNEAMITVNFGRGTPEQAAAWVKHCNVDNDYNVRYWEVGNELYGDWHPSHCSAEEYGSRAAEFIKAMKAVDPTILVTVVWVLEGAWNKTVFEHTADIADGVNVHHYPQHAGEENDFALLAAPQSLNDIIPTVRSQVKEYGLADKTYEIWLTEWNSVDFKPGVQTLSIVNGLFLADYLGTLAKHNIEQASYWDIHNDITPQGGDYGYLSRTGAPDGDNVPRLSYWAFKLAATSLRGKLMQVRSSNENVTAYLTQSQGDHISLMLVNKMPYTKAIVSLENTGLNGKVTIRQLSDGHAGDGYSTELRNLQKGTSITLPAWSLTSISRTREN
ncbi:MAG: carbohydrate-binding protein [Chitinivibrionales bacterium]|nr:carbohydrate-binding protein [Chitinivibrionales bacterium]